MSQMNVFYTPIQKNIEQLFALAQESLIIVSPWLKEDAVKNIFKNITNRSLEVKVLTVGNKEHFLSGSSDLEAFYFLFDMGAEIKLLSNLHAKVYIADNDYAVITSANFTNSGLNKNLEMGYFVTSPEEIAFIKDTVNSWYEQGRQVNKNWLVDIEAFMRDYQEEFRVIKEKIKDICKEDIKDDIGKHTNKYKNIENIELLDKEVDVYIDKEIGFDVMQEYIENKSLFNVYNTVNNYVNQYQYISGKSKNHIEMGKLLRDDTQKLLDYLNLNIEHLTPEAIYNFAENLRKFTKSTVLTNARKRKFSSKEAFSSLLFSINETSNYNVTKGHYPAICSKLESILSRKYSYNNIERKWEKR